MQLYKSTYKSTISKIYLTYSKGTGSTTWYISTNYTKLPL